MEQLNRWRTWVPKEQKERNICQEGIADQLSPTLCVGLQHSSTPIELSLLGVWCNITFEGTQRYNCSTAMSFFKSVQSCALSGYCCCMYEVYNLPLEWTVLGEMLGSQLTWLSHGDVGDRVAQSLWLFSLATNFSNCLAPEVLDSFSSYPLLA